MAEAASNDRARIDATLAALPDPYGRVACQWIEADFAPGQAAQAQKCGAARVPQRPYCLCHMRRAYVSREALQCQAV